MDKRLDSIKKIKSRFGVITKNYLAPKGSGLIYWRYRVLRPLLKLKYRHFRRKGDLPWLSPPSIEFFEGYLDGTQVGCEFGSGASTLFFAHRTKTFVSVEHYQPWFDIVNKKLKENNIQNVEYLFIPQQTPDSELKTIDLFPDIRGAEKYEFRKDYIKYFQALHDYQDEHFDFIIIDGRARPECLFSSIPKLKPNGLMILDNSERDRYKIVFDNLKDWEMVDTTNGLTNTTFWVKPCN